MSRVGQKTSLLAAVVVGSMIVLLLLPTILFAQGGPSTPMPTPPTTARSLTPTPTPQGTPVGSPPHSPLSTEGRGYSDLVVSFSDGLNFDPPLHYLGAYNEPISFHLSCWNEPWPYENCKLFAGLKDGNDYTVQWQGTLWVPTSGDYTFHLADVDDGAQLFLSDVLIADRGWNFPNPDTLGPIQVRRLNAGSYGIKISYRQTVRYVAALQVLWAGPGFAEEAIPLLSMECPLAEVVSLRRLDDQTLGVVGFVEPRGFDGRQIETVTLRAIAEGTVIQAEGNLVDLAEQSVPGGSLSEIPETAGLWSTVLRADGSFPRQFRLELETTDSTGGICAEGMPVSLEGPDWMIETENLDALGTGNPAEEGIPLVAGVGLSPLGALPITVRLSRYVPNPASSGLPGSWNMIAQKLYPLKSEFWSWDFNVPANFVDPGENLYRVVAVRSPQEGVEDLDGFYAAVDTDDLMTGGALQVRQALVFRDTVRAVLSGDSDYAGIYPEALVLAMGTLESGDTFDNATRGNGIMQVTCASEMKGYTEFRKRCDSTTPDYVTTCRSIEFNVQDAMLVLHSFYLGAKDPRSRGDFILSDDGRRDILTTAVVRYRGGPFFLTHFRDPEQCPDRGYPGAVSRRLLGWEGDPFVPLYQVLGDSDYYPHLIGMDELRQRLDTAYHFIMAEIPACP